MNKYFWRLIVSLSLSIYSPIIIGANFLEYNISIENHYFQPSIIEIPAGQKIRLTVCNNDKTIEEFESIDLKREKIIPSHTCVHIILAPLKPGKYNFMGEFHQDTANGHIIVK
ncbi:Cupredoxin domain-containing protein [Candidatus Trichorickettsia mobilis]|uniref:Cupredoxin domain-containing protein n=1 Tax=Candidatus Trichorickettsia mobilis TaxID=1346319 RepID=A0ABZ0UQS1_9RICK|nr:cupredoxin domain-containing protein [Candidatus Trichorickettsia mobilis]WPY00395.1 Cupredoxin domain-containing protein [Candidatus Trichorickettsia mobilis]